MARRSATPTASGRADRARPTRAPASPPAKAARPGEAEEPRSNTSPTAAGMRASPPSHTRARRAAVCRPSRGLGREIRQGGQEDEASEHGAPPRRPSVATIHSPASQAGASSAAMAAWGHWRSSAPADPGADGPEQQASGPVLLEMEDLPREEDSAAERRRSAGVKRGREPRRAIRREGPGQVQSTHRRQHQSERWPGPRPSQCAATKSRMPAPSSSPPKTQGRAMRATEAPARRDARGLPGADPGRRRLIEQPGLDPSPERRLPLGGHLTAWRTFRVWR